MTGSTWFDLALFAVALAAAISGWLNGAAAAGFALLGVGIGATSGLLVAPHLVSEIDTPVARLIVGLTVVAIMVTVGQVAGVTIGRAARRYITGGVARVIDSMIGAVLQAVAVLLVAWLVAIPISTQESSGLAGTIRGSAVLARIDDVSPDVLRTVPGAFTNMIGDTGFPDILGPFSRTPLQEVPQPDPALRESPVVQAVEPAVVKVLGRAESCSRALEGSGFVIGPDLVMTNAHVVAGTESVRVTNIVGDYQATVVRYDSGVDVAVLRVPGLGVEALALAENPAVTGDNAIVLGYPGNGPYRADTARIRERVTLRGPDIYRSDTVEREVYTLRGIVREGNSGGPLLDPQGRVLGVVFGAAMDAGDTGYALTVDQVRSHIDAAASATEPAETGKCVGVPTG